MEEIQLLENEQFKQIVGFENYWISNKGRCYNSKTKKFVGANSSGYVLVSLCNEGGYITTTMHDLVMQYFGTPKPEGDYEIDHLNHIRDDNRIENLRWVNRSQNQKHKTSYNGVEQEYFDYNVLDDFDELIEVRDYGNHQFEDYWFANGFFYFDTGVNLRRLHINFDKRDSAFVCARDTNNKQTNIYYTKFKKLYDLN